MSAEAQALVRQLTENPEVLESMQHMIALLRANPPQSSSSHSGGGSGGGSSASRQTHAQARPGQRGRPPRTGYASGPRAEGVDELSRAAELPTHRQPHSSDGTGHSRATSTSATSLTQEVPSFYINTSSALDAPTSPTQTFAPAPPRSGTGGGLPLPPSSTAGPGAAPAARREPRAASHEARTATTQRLTEAQRRITELERELQRTSQRVDQLSDVVQRQKAELGAAQDRHVLEMEEARHAYDAVLQRKDEVQEEALRQVLKSRQLMVSAAKYEAAVAANKALRTQAKENQTADATGVAVRKTQSGGIVSSGGLTTGHASVNTRPQPGGGGVSGLKRERAYDDEDDELVTADAYAAVTPAERREAPSPRQAGRRAVAKAEASPAYITTPTAAGKMSTALVDARTQSRSARKRRTPRTPSLTNADRSARTPGAVAGGMSQHRLPGTTSLKLDSPTPVVSTAWTAGRSLTKSLTPPPASALAYTVADAVARQQPHQQRVDHRAAPALPAHPTRPPLTQRAAGRLPAGAPPPAPAAEPRSAVPNTRSGTSSIASGGPTRSPSPVNPKRGAALPRRFIFTGLKDDEPLRLAEAIAAIGGDAAALASDLDEPPPTSTTHVVLRGTPRSVKALCGVVSGKWLVSPEYVYNSEQSGFWLDELEEGGLRIFPPPLRCQRFLLTVEHPSIRAKLAQVIEYGGGEVLPGGASTRNAGVGGGGGGVAQDVIVITSGDDLLRYATQDRV